MLNNKILLKKIPAIAITALIACSTIVFAADKILVDRFILPETCSACHSEIFEQWENSMHNLSHKDPVYLGLAKFLRKGLTDAGEIEEAESCVKCHTPVGYLTGYPKNFSDDLSKTPEIATQGIQCDYCHSATAIEQMYNNGLVISPGHGEDDPGTKYGPFDDSSPDFHEAQYSRIHTQSQICGTCHDVKHVAFGTDLETTYTEWANSPYNNKDPEKAITCQGCHMYQRPGIAATASTPRPPNPGSASDDSETRPHIFTHYFVGANSSVPALFGGESKAQMARKRLENAATLAVDTSRINEKKLDIIVINSGAGHSIPTGVSDLRQVWLEITVQDKNNTKMFESGILNHKKELSKDAVIFRTVFGDGQGNEVINLAKAREVLFDNRIKAGQSLTRTITLPAVPEQGSTIMVRLLYRGMSQKILNLIPENTIKPLPIVEMAKVQQSI